MAIALENIHEPLALNSNLSKSIQNITQWLYSIRHRICGIDPQTLLRDWMKNLLNQAPKKKWHPSQVILKGTIVNLTNFPAIFSGQGIHFFSGKRQVRKWTSDKWYLFRSGLS